MCRRIFILSYWNIRKEWLHHVSRYRFGSNTVLNIWRQMLWVEGILWLPPYMNLSRGRKSGEGCLLRYLLFPTGTKCIGRCWRSDVFRSYSMILEYTELPHAALWFSQGPNHEMFPFCSPFVQACRGTRLQPVGYLLSTLTSTGNDHHWAHNLCGGPI